MALWDFYNPNARAVASSGNQANAALTIALAPGANQRAHVTGFEITGLGATAASTVVVTLGPLLNSGGAAVTLTYILEIVAGVTTPVTSLIVEFLDPLPCSVIGGNLTLTCAAFGAGNTNSAANLHGFFTAN